MTGEEIVLGSLPKGANRASRCSVLRLRAEFRTAAG